MRAILTYHSIDPSGSVISMDADRLRAHLRWLASSPVEVVPLAEIADLPGDADAVALTFDDGFVNFETEALPELERWGLPATLFVVSGHVGRTNRWGGRAEDGIPELPLLDWNGVGRVAERGVEIGAHTVTHAWLPGLDAGHLAEELRGSAETLAREIGRPVTSFAYPYGATSDEAVAGSRTLFARACTAELRPLREREDPHLLPRLDAYYFRAPGALENWGGRAFRWRLRVRASGRRLRSLVSPRGAPSDPARPDAGEAVRGGP